MARPVSKLERDAPVKVDPSALASVRALAEARGLPVQDVLTRAIFAGLSELEFPVADGAAVVAVQATLPGDSAAPYVVRVGVSSPNEIPRPLAARMK